MAIKSICPCCWSIVSNESFDPIASVFSAYYLYCVVFIAFDWRYKLFISRWHNLLQQTFTIYLHYHPVWRCTVILHSRENLHPIYSSISIYCKKKQNKRSFILSFASVLLLISVDTTNYFEIYTFLLRNRVPQFYSVQSNALNYWDILREMTCTFFTYLLAFNIICFFLVSMHVWL